MAKTIKDEDVANSVALGDEGYVGTSPEYQHHASDTLAPLVDGESEGNPEQVMLDRQRKFEADRAKGVGFHGYSVDDTTPAGERRTAGQTRLDEEAVIRKADAARAQDFLDARNAEPTTDDDADPDAPAPEAPAEGTVSPV